MKKMILFCILSFVMILLSSCSTTLIHNCKCERDKEQFVGDVVEKLQEESFYMLRKEPYEGYIKAQKKDMEGTATTWTFMLSDGKLNATCFTGTESVPKYLDDNSDPNFKPYWDIRNFLEKYCGEKFIIIQD